MEKKEKKTLPFSSAFLSHFVYSCIIWSGLWEGIFCSTPKQKRSPNWLVKHACTATMFVKLVSPITFVQRC